jgi:hypothetical protein
LNDKSGRYNSDAATASFIDTEMTEPSAGVVKSHRRDADDVKGLAKLYRCPNSIWAIKAQMPTME